MKLQWECVRIDQSVPVFQLGPGAFVTVPSVLVKRCKHHFHRLPCGVALVLGTCHPQRLDDAFQSFSVFHPLPLHAGNNGYIWIGSHLSEDTTQKHQQTAVGTRQWL
jgi:exosome complex component RRP4